MKSKFLPLTLFMILFSTSAYSQHSGRIGLSGTIQDNQFGILAPIWLSEKFVIAPAFDLKVVEKTGIDVGIAIAPRYYLKKNRLAPYVGVKAGALINKPSEDLITDPETKIDWLGGVAFGGEYFLSDHFSFGVEVQGNFTKSHKNSNRFGNPDRMAFNTGTMISATVYF